MLQRRMSARDVAIHLSNEASIAEVAAAAGRERHATARLVALLAELDARRLYLGAGYSSLFTYCTRGAAPVGARRVWTHRGGPGRAAAFRIILERAWWTAL